MVINYGNKNNWIIYKNHIMVSKITLSLKNHHLTINQLRKYKIKKRNDLYQIIYKSL